MGFDYASIADPVLKAADMDRYRQMMSDIKQRTWFISNLPTRQEEPVKGDLPKWDSVWTDKSAKAHYVHHYHVEFAYLQFRRILETIAFASLVTNEQIFFQHFNKLDYKNKWRLERILEDVASINPDFYPDPIKTVPSHDPDVRHAWVARTDHLTKSDMVDLYKRCGEILHTTNPYKPALDYGPFGSEISGWLSKVIALLEKHKVRLLGTKSTILVQMGAYGQPVTCTTFIHCPPELKTKIDAANGKK